MAIIPLRAPAEGNARLSTQTLDAGNLISRETLLYGEGQPIGAKAIDFGFVSMYGNLYYLRKKEDALDRAEAANRGMLNKQ